MLKRIGILIITIISLLGLSSCGFEFKEPQLYETEDFVYCYIEGAGDNGPNVSGDYIAILELTEEGQEKDVIVIPDEIEGKPVIQIGMEGLGYIYDLREGIYTSIYLPKDLKSMRGDIYNDYKNNFKRYIINYGEYKKIKTINTHFYVSSTAYNQAIEDGIIDAKTGKFNGEENYATLIIANLEFISDNEIYFIANYEQEEKITYIPTNPTREGYTFEGWYKEEECKNKYDFENETFHLEEGEEILRLYAKWV